MPSNPPNDDTLLLLMVIAELSGVKCDPKHILNLYDTKVNQLRDYRMPRR
jgi:hypothetical protein